MECNCHQNRWPLLCTLTCRLTALFNSSGHLGLTSKHAAPSPLLQFPSLSTSSPLPHPDLFLLTQLTPSSQPHVIMCHQAPLVIPYSLQMCFFFNIMMFQIQTQWKNREFLMRDFQLGKSLNKQSPTVPLCNCSEESIVKTSLIITNTISNQRVELKKG